MSEAGEMAPASGPTLAAGQERARDPETGRFKGTDGWGRSPAERSIIAARRADVARRYPKQTPADIAHELDGGRWAKPTIDKDVAELAKLGIVERQGLGPRRKCPDAEPRVCENPDCPRGGEPFTPDPWAADQRYCRIPCARADATERVRETARQLLTKQHRRAEAEVARLNAAGYLTSRQFADERGVVDSAVSRWIADGLLRAERRVVAGVPHRIIARSELERFNAEVWPRTINRMGPNFPKNWRGPRRRFWSRRLRAPTVGRLGGPRPKYDEDQATAVRRAKTAYPTWGPITIARVINKAMPNKEPVTPKQVRGILAKPHS